MVLQGYLTRCGACCAAGCGQSAPHNTSLARACTPPRPAPIHQIASAAMPVRRGARPGREHRHTLDVRTVRLCAFRMHGDASCRGPAPALRVLQASTRSRRARARVRVRVSQGPSLPRPVVRYTTERAGRLGGARPTERPKGGYGLARVPSSGGAPVAPWCRGEASSWSPVVEKKSNGRTALAAVKTLESSTTWLA